MFAVIIIIIIITINTIILNIIAAARCLFVLYIHRKFHWEKPSCFKLGLMLYLPVTIGFFFIEADPAWVVYVSAAGAGVGTATIFLLPALMLPDCVDEAELISGEHHEGVFYSFFVFFAKLAAGMAILGRQASDQAANTPSPPPVCP